MIGEVLPSHRQRRCCATIAVFALLLSLAPSPALAQDARGAVTGRVVDSSGGVLPGVSVSVVNTATNAATNVVTNDTGNYTALFLLPGTYTVTATLTGFKSVRQGDIIVRVGDRIVIDLTMAPGGVEEQIVVNAQSPILETGTATMGQVIDAKLISGDSPRRRHGLRPDPADSRRHVRTLVRVAAADGQRQPARHDGDRHYQQRVLDRRLEQRRVAGPRRHPAARRGHSGIQGEHRRLRQPDRSHRGGQRGPRAQERHQSLQPGGIVLQPRRRAIGGSLRVQAEQHRQDDPRLQPLRRDRIGPDLQEQDLLHGVVREAPGRHRRVAHDVGADRADADRRLL